jgi:cobalt-zinc-cadmium efflux system membrane fusion protein
MTRGNAMQRKLIAAAIAALFLAACGGEKHDDHAKADARKAEAADAHGKEDLVKLSDEEIKRSNVRSEAIAEMTLSGELTLTANVQANQDALAHIAPRVPGRIVAVYASLGANVKAGQPLALLDSLEVGEAQSAYLQASSEAKLAAAAFARAEKLHVEQVMPTKDWQRARYENEKARAQLAAATDKLRMLGVSPQGDRAASTFPVAAPIGGTVTEKHAVLGELAKPDASLFTVVNLSTLWITANVAEKDLSIVRVGAAAKVSVAAWPGQSFAGKVTYVGATVDKETRTIAARIEVPNPDGRLKPDMFATAVIPTGATSKALTLPESAITLLQGLSTVFVEEGAGFEARPVELGERAGGRVTVKSGLKAGELVVVDGVYALKARALKSQIGSGHVH